MWALSGFSLAISFPLLGIPLLARGLLLRKRFPVSQVAVLRNNLFWLQLFLEECRKGRSHALVLSSSVRKLVELCAVLVYRLLVVLESCMWYAGLLVLLNLKFFVVLT